VRSLLNIGQLFISTLKLGKENVHRLIRLGIIAC